MSSMIPFTFESHSVRVLADERGEPRFVAKDVAVALGYKNTNDAIRQHCKGVVNRYPLSTSGGTQEVRVIREPDVYRLIVKSALPSAETFERLVFEEILPTIRKSGSYSVGQKSDFETLFPVGREMRAAASIAKAIGFKGNQAVLSANKAVRRVTGIDVLREFEATHLVADSQDALFTVTEIGQRAGISPRRVNPVLEEIGLVRGYRDHKDRQCWELTTRGEQAGGVYLDTGKKHSDGTPVRQIKWTGNIVSMLTVMTSVPIRSRIRRDRTASVESESYC